MIRLSASSEIAAWTLIHLSSMWIAQTLWLRRKPVGVVGSTSSSGKEVRPARPKSAHFLLTFGRCALSLRERLHPSAAMLENIAIASQV
jgi:hypothetical protein